MDRKKILILAIVLCFIAVLAGGSIAYFTYSDNLTNKFMIATFDPENPDISADELFSVRVYEHDKNGNEVYSNSYTDIAPASILKKDPTVENTGEYSAWVRMRVVITNASSWLKVCQKHNVELSSIFNGVNEQKWLLDEDYILDEDKDTITYFYYYEDALDKDEYVTLFENVVIPANFDAEDMVALKYFEINIFADAIQEANTGDSAYYAFENYWS